jgi:hypothetical protein
MTRFGHLLIVASLLGSPKTHADAIPSTAWQGGDKRFLAPHESLAAPAHSGPALNTSLTQDVQDAQDVNVMTSKADKDVASFVAKFNAIKFGNSDAIASWFTSNASSKMNQGVAAYVSKELFQPSVGQGSHIGNASMPEHGDGGIPTASAAPAGTDGTCYGNCMYIAFQQWQMKKSLCPDLIAQRDRLSEASAAETVLDLCGQDSNNRSELCVKECANWDL